MTDTPEHERPSALIWLHLVKAGEFQLSTEISHALRDHYFANFATSLRDMRKNGSVSVREVGGRLLRYGATPTCRVPQGLKVRDVLDAMESLRESLQAEA